MPARAKKMTHSSASTASASFDWLGSPPTTKTTSVQDSFDMWPGGSTACGARLALPAAPLENQFRNGLRSAAHVSGESPSPVPHCSAESPGPHCSAAALRFNASPILSPSFGAEEENMAGESASLEAAADGPPLPLLELLAALSAIRSSQQVRETKSAELENAVMRREIITMRKQVAREQRMHKFLAMHEARRMAAAKGGA